MTKQELLKTVKDTIDTYKKGSFGEFQLAMAKLENIVDNPYRRVT